MPRDHGNGRVGVSESIHRFRQQAISLRTAGQPLPEPFEVEQRTNLRIRIRHLQQQFAEALYRFGSFAIEYGEVAVVVGRCLRDNMRAAGGNRPFLNEQQMIAVDQARSVAIAAPGRTTSMT